MSHLKIHYQVYQTGGADANDAWLREKLIPNKAKFCDDLMLGIERSGDFTKDTDYVDCKKCQNKIDTRAKNGFDLPY